MSAHVAGSFALRATRLLVVLIAVSFLAQFLINLLPGDPALAILGTGATEEALVELREAMNLNQNPLYRYGEWLVAALQGDLGESVTSGRSVSEAIGQRLPLTLELLVISIVLALAVALALALLTADKPSGLSARLASGISLVFLSSPTFVIGIGLAALVGLKLGWLPVSGYKPLEDGLGPHVRSIILPVLTLALGQIALFYRMLHVDLSATLKEDYIVLARVRGYGRWRVLWRHALRPSFTSLLTVIGLSLGAMMGGSVIVESLFGLPGLGSLLIDASLSRDFVTVQGAVVVIAFAYVVINLSVDVLYAVVDPRIRG
ncbi:ABC transporter permease [Actinomadura sp. 7K507]|uniref:ABC transporter permease n=1 Tax=Actinomadura sp. 7K507 TaxID=2530365 RepID=UPI001046E19A|nr:ABC transporter permease [Actinomadura sp. 7K507]TDC92995.1 ABC transporter permease [Actinomadura sp. 7K507]